MLKAYAEGGGNKNAPGAPKRNNYTRAEENSIYGGYNNMPVRTGNGRGRNNNTANGRNR